MTRVLASAASVLIALVLGGCSDLPAPDALALSAPLVPAVVDTQAVDTQAVDTQAVDTPAVVGVPVASASEEGQRVSYRRVPDEVSSSVALKNFETRIAVMPQALTSIEIFSVASQDSEVKITLQRFDEFNQPRVFRVVGESGDFFHVQVPMRPNGSTGWIRKSDVDVASTQQRIVIDLSDRSVVVWDGGDIVLSATGTIGQPGSPTPTGSFFVRNVFDWYADSIYGPYVIPLSAYSETIDQINGGDAVVAIHGTQRPDLIGSAASLGCVRLDNDTLRQLAAIVEPGAPVDVIE